MVHRLLVELTASVRLILGSRPQATGVTPSSSVQFRTMLSTVPNAAHLLAMASFLQESAQVVQPLARSTQDSFHSRCPEAESLMTAQLAHPGLCSRHEAAGGSGSVEPDPPGSTGAPLSPAAPH